MTADDNSRILEPSQALITGVLDVKRDMELVRELLLEIEANPQLIGRQCIDLPVGNRNPEEMAYTLSLLIGEGIVSGHIGMTMPLVSGLTWKGHELLDNIRDDHVWAGTKAAIKPLASVSVALLAEIAKGEIKRLLGLP